MSDSTIKVYGALKLTVKMLLMWNSTIKVDGNPDDFMLATSTIETSNLVILRVRTLMPFDISTSLQESESIMMVYNFLHQLHMS